MSSDPEMAVTVVQASWELQYATSVALKAKRKKKSKNAGALTQDVKSNTAYDMMQGVTHANSWEQNKCQRISVVLSSFQVTPTNHLDFSLLELNSPCP